MLNIRLVFLRCQFLPVAENFSRELLGTFLAERLLSLDLVALLIPRLLGILLEHDAQEAIIVLLAVTSMRVGQEEQAVVAITILNLINKLVKLGRIDQTVDIFAGRLATLRIIFHLL